MISADGRFVAFHQRCERFGGKRYQRYQRRVRAGSAAGDDYVGEHQPVWNRVWQWLFGRPRVALVISADGRFVAFSSVATDLVANDTNGTRRRVRASCRALRKCGIQDLSQALHNHSPSRLSVAFF